MPEMFLPLVPFIERLSSHLRVFIREIKKKTSKNQNFDLEFSEGHNFLITTNMGVGAYAG